MASSSSEAAGTPGQLQTSICPTWVEPGLQGTAYGDVETRNTTSDLRRAHTVSHSTNTKDKHTANAKTIREQIATSFLRVKDSHELLRKRSFKRANPSKAAGDSLPASREPNHFTVGNVGQNGTIFLRPIHNPSIKEPFQAPSAPSLNKSRQEHHLEPHAHTGRGGTEPSRWSNSQLSEFRPDLIPEEDPEDDESVDTESAHSQHHHPLHPRPRKAQSFSTISEQWSELRVGRPGDLQIFIDQAADRPKTADEPLRRPSGSALTPYHLGWSPPNLDNEAPLHSSVYVRTSLSTDMRASNIPRDYWIGTAAPNTCIGDPTRPSFVGSFFSGTGAIEMPQRAAINEHSAFYEPKEPIEPSIFEILASEMDKESVVRYIADTKEISAATPARIVAQISSASFMDYELVSDFFLTFRSYLAPSTLLALLLARLRWAINRPQDDGRIIRIRTFAALRHWILNYFADDFVPNYGLRASFCEMINSMYTDVKARQGGGMSDLKILIDLKRCWYGKCSVYWDTAEQHVAFHSPEIAIRPGGREDDITLETGGNIMLAVGGPEFNMEAGLERSVSHTASHHQRNNSATTTGSLPMTTMSDRSIHATSCSLPPKSPKRLSLAVTSNKAPHLVPLAPLKLTSSRDALPSSLSTRRHPYSGHKHKRSGSFSDSVRDDRAPYSFLSPGQHPTASSYGVLNLGSLIRGELYPPAESYTIMMAPPSPPLPSSARDKSPNRRSTFNTTAKPSSPGSGVKTIIGSIRRALHSRHGGPGGSRTTQGQTNPSYLGRTSALPNNVAFGSDLYRDKKATAATKRRIRIDTLCDEALRQYRAAVTDQAETKPVVLRSETPRHPTVTADEIEPHLATPGLTRMNSQLTTGSESIVIVDGTGLAVPMMSGALGSNAGLEEAPRFLDTEISRNLRTPSLLAHSQRSTLATGEYSLPIYLDESESGPSTRASKFLRPSGSNTSRRSYSVERGSASWKHTSPSLRLRKYASFQSGISKLRLTLGSEPGVPVPGQHSRQEVDRPAGPMLRRRPGGDLRQMRNESCPQSRVNSELMLSDNSYRTSGADSFDTQLENLGSRPQTSLIPPNPRYSLITTHSSQNMRRSFEAAIAQFAQIPDDGDGGVESALLKLEGKWQGQPASDYEAVPVGTETCTQGYVLGNVCEEDRCYQGQAAQHHPSSANAAGRRETFLGNSLTYSQIQGRLVHRRDNSLSVAETENSYSSIPLLERGLSDDSMKKPNSRPSSKVASSSRMQVRDISTSGTMDVDSSHSSLDIVKKTESLNRIPRGSTLPTVPHESRKQFRHLSGLSSEISVDLIDTREAVEQRLSLDTHRLSDMSLGIPTHPLAHPPSPPMTIQNTRSMSCATPLNPVLFPTEPLTPDPSPRNAAEQADGRALDVQHVSGDVLSRSEKHRQLPPPLNNNTEPDHVPFVLSCESHVLAQQLTIVEMAALSEVDWRDLIDMRWSSGSPSALSWIQFLKEGESRGIDLVVGRFNLMVKWVLSEIVLTLDLHERARTIAKFIHTAVHARRMCNYATMLQIAIALSSTDCSRLQSTWALVPPADKQLLKDMESLIQPIRNFHDLRVEMETANAQDGCIPFVGLYVHDLTYNAQKPAQVTTYDGEPLINFERYRTTAKIVKSLLRLIDSSTKYKFDPIPGIIERCLWIASLSEEQVQLRSKQLE